jgi:MOSC domain-containing protein YiiM
MRAVAVLSSIQVAMPASYGSENASNLHDRGWTTGFFKTSVEGPVFAGTTNLEGDGQAFGENLTVAGLTEGTVHIGDVFGIGEAKFEVSQPRQPCWKLARRWRMHELPGLVVQNGRSGWYLRVLKPGRIARQMSVTLLVRPNPEWSIARANQVLYHGRDDLALTRHLAGVPRLADSWVEELRARAEALAHRTSGGNR